MDLLEHVRTSISARKLLSRGQSVLVAVSGGVDSMVLLHVLHKPAEKQRWKLAVAHFNHRLRGRASDGDEAFVRKTAANLGLKCFVDRGNVKAAAKAKGQSIEMAAREMRHAFLARAAHRANCSAMALAHHADDQVELFFLRLLRGSGSEGLSGMKWQNASPADKRLRLIRPLLDVTKADLQKFARQHGIRFREDATNASTDIQRNRIRHKLLPQLRREFHSSLDRAILRTMEIVGAESDVASAFAEKSFTKESRFTKLPVAIQRKILQLQLRRKNIAPDFDLIESLRAEPVKVLMVRPGVTIQRDKSGRITELKRSENEFSAHARAVKLKGRAGEIRFGGTRIEWCITAEKGARLNAGVLGYEAFDADEIGTKLTIRHWQAGDRYRPIGMGTAIKLQDWFTNAKVPRARRHELLVATASDGEIFWVEGQRIAERFKLTSRTRKRLIWRWQRK